MLGAEARGAAPRSETASRRPCGGSPRGARVRVAVNQRGRVLELGHQAVDDRRFSFVTHPWLRGRIVRISKIEIIGRKRRNRNSSDRKQADGGAEETSTSPRNVGRVAAPRTKAGKSRCRLSTMIHESARATCRRLTMRRDDEQAGHAGADPLQPEQLRNDDRCRGSAPQ